MIKLTNMKKSLVIIIIASLTFSSCDSAKKAFQRGSYDMACMMAIKKLQKKPYDEEHAKIFTVSYQKANQKNIDRIEYLKQSKDKRTWDEILTLYKKLERRQELAETVLPIRVEGKTINFEHINYNEQIIEAKNSAAYFHYNEGVKLMSGDRKDARKAYQHFVNVRHYTNNYNDLKQRIKAAKEKGTIKVLMSTINKTAADLPIRFLQDLTNIGTKHVDDRWRRYYNAPINSEFDYSAFVVINSVRIGPNNVDEKKDIVRKEVLDGWKYELNAQGNVKKDSVGNDIKVPKYRIISCTITKKIQSKTATIFVSVDIQDNKTGRIVSSTPIKSSSKFSYTSSYANGDINALSPELRKTLGKSPISFPSDEDMLEKTRTDLKNKIISALKRSKHLII